MKNKKAEKTIQWMREYAEHRINSLLMDERRCIPPYIVLDFGNQGILGLQVPENYNGLGLNHTESMQVIEQLAAIDTTLASFVGVNNALGVRPIMNYAKEEIKKKYLPQLGNGRILASLAFTEPAAGSFIRNIETVAEEKNGKWILNGKKIWIGSAGWSELINIFVKIPKNDRTVQFAGFTLLQGTPGLIMGDEALTVGLRGMLQNEVILNNCEVSNEWMLGDLTQGIEIAEDAMNFGRIGIAGMALGAMKRALQLLLRFANKRSISSGKLIESTLLHQNLYQSLVKVQAIESLMYSITHNLDEGVAVPPEFGSCAKVLGSEFCWQIIDIALQGLGGRGYIETNLLALMMKDVRVLRIFEGASEVLTCFTGALALYGKGTFYAFLKDNWQALEIADKIQTGILALKNQAGDETNLDHLYFKAGEIVFFGLLLAAVKKRNDFLFAEQTRIWAEEQFNKKLSLSEARFPLASQKEIAEVIESYQESIGNITQKAPGVNVDFDDYLK